MKRDLSFNVSANELFQFQTFNIRRCTFVLISLQFSLSVGLFVCHHFKISNTDPVYHLRPHILYIFGYWMIYHLAMTMIHAKTNTKTNTQTKTKINSKCLKDPMYVTFFKKQMFQGFEIGYWLSSGDNKTQRMTRFFLLLLGRMQSHTGCICLMDCLSE